ncbi:MAG: nicotinate-nucleotide adenylyltransferase [Candidatus Omnitrophica bacterium]|nr:nicotinate-nucleotide adenylyltransferase [Candidatus Omnitrophota bacterium]
MAKLEVKPGSKVGILGGSFDPPHIGHFVLAECALTALKLDRVIFVPLSIPPHKKLPQANPTDRYRMLRLAAIDNPVFGVSDIEIKRKGPSYSYDTILKLKKDNPDTTFYFILGADAFNGLKSWKNYDGLVDLVDFIVAVRTRTKIVNLKRARFHKIKIPRIDISSSSIRDMVKNGLPIRFLVPETVRGYISQHNLYR